MPPETATPRLEDYCYETPTDMHAGQYECFKTALLADIADLNAAR